MVSEAKLYMSRAEDEFLLAQKDIQISTDENTKKFLGIQKDKTFFHSVISHAYYSIFYCAKSYLMTRGIITKAPDEHEKTYNELAKFVKNGMLNYELLKIYEHEIIKADALLQIFKLEKGKRGNFIYNIKSESNLPYAKESIENAKKFISIIKGLTGF